MKNLLALVALALAAVATWISWSHAPRSSQPAPAAPVDLTPLAGRIAALEERLARDQSAVELAPVPSDDLRAPVLDAPPSAADADLLARVARLEALLEELRSDRRAAPSAPLLRERESDAALIERAAAIANDPRLTEGERLLGLHSLRGEELADGTDARLLVLDEMLHLAQTSTSGAIRADVWRQMNHLTDERMKQPLLDASPSTPPSARARRPPRPSPTSSRTPTSRPPCASPSTTSRPGSAGRPPSRSSAAADPASLLALERGAAGAIASGHPAPGQGAGAGVEQVSSGNRSQHQRCAPNPPSRKPCTHLASASTSSRCAEGLLPRSLPIHPGAEAGAICSIHSEGSSSPRRSSSSAAPRLQAIDQPVSRQLSTPTTSQPPPCTAASSARARPRPAGCGSAASSGATPEKRTFWEKLTIVCGEGRGQGLPAERDHEERASGAGFSWCRNPWVAEDFLGRPLWLVRRGLPGQKGPSSRLRPTGAPRTPAAPGTTRSSPAARPPGTTAPPSPGPGAPWRSRGSGGGSRG